MLSGAVVGRDLVGHAAEPAEGPPLGVGLPAGAGREGEALRRARGGALQEEEGALPPAPGRDHAGETLFRARSAVRKLINCRSHAVKTTSPARRELALAGSTFEPGPL